MEEFNFEKWDQLFDDKAKAIYPMVDPAHDYSHIIRVLKISLDLAKEEKADLNIIVPAAYLHDYINVPKRDPRRKQASVLSAEAAEKYLLSVNYPKIYIEGIKHAIITHSFSASITAETIEAKIIQDADRLDALGSIGLARLLSTTSLMERPYYDIKDPWAENRELDDNKVAIDHLFIKPFKIVDTMHTEGARIEAQKRIKRMKYFVEGLRLEI